MLQRRPTSVHSQSPNAVDFANYFWLRKGKGKGKAWILDIPLLTGG